VGSVDVAQSYIPTPTPWSLSDQSGGLDPPRLRVRGSAPSVTHHAAFVQMETLRQYNLAQRREDKKKVLARPVILQSYFGDDADVTVIPIIQSSELRERT
jgi:hypothetical protein